MENTIYLSSAYLAPVEYYTKLFACEKAYVEQYDNYVKQTYRNRCVIAAADGPLALTIPTEKSGTPKCLMKDVRISDHGNWRHIHWNALVAAYRNSPFFEYYADDFHVFYEKKYAFLWDYNQEICSLVCDLIDIHPRMEGTTEYCMEFVPGEVDFRETIHPKRDWREADADFCPKPYYQVFDAKYGFRDYRGGGRSSGRETIGRVAAGAIAAKILEQMGITVFAYTRSIGPVDADLTKFNRTTARSTITAMPDAEADEKACAYLQQAREACDSVGGCMECLVEGLPAGIGDPVFEKLDANLAKAIMSIGAVKAVEIGDGAEASRHTGSENNDPFRMENGKVVKASNHSGGTLGGMSDGSPLLIRAYVKPTPSIFRPQQTVNCSGENTELTIRGRHDPIIVPRAVVVMECMTAITVLDAMMGRMEEYTSFSGAPEGAVSSMKFLYKTAENVEPAASVVQQAAPAEADNFFVRLWKKFIALFQF